jgi:hypothetical protein
MKRIRTVAAFGGSALYISADSLKPYFRVIELRNHTSCPNGPGLKCRAPARSS